MLQKEEEKKTSLSYINISSVIKNNNNKRTLIASTRS